MIPKIIIFFKEKLFPSKYKLSKVENKYLITNPEEFENLIHPNEEIYKTLDNYLQKYLDILISKLPPKYLQAMYSNLSSLKVDKSLGTKDQILNIIEALFKKTYTMGYYSPLKNNIKMLSIKEYKTIAIILNEELTYNQLLEKTIPHELIHMASSIIINNIFYCGFYQVSKDIKIGYSLNEGYTELLTERYFSFKSNSYDFELSIASLIEKILDREYMTEMYFTMNLKSVFENLSHLSNEKETYNFLKNLDFITENKFNRGLIIKEKINNKLCEIGNYLIKVFQQKLSQISIPAEQKEIYLKNFQEEILKIINDYNNKDHSTQINQSKKR